MDFVNAETEFLNSSPVGTKLGAVGFHLYHFCTPYVAVSKGGERKWNYLDATWFHDWIKKWGKSESNVLLVPSFTNDFEDMTIKRFRWRKEGSGTLRVVPKVLFYHIRPSSLAQSNWRVSKWDLVSYYLTKQEEYSIFHFIPRVLHSLEDIIQEGGPCRS